MNWENLDVIERSSTRVSGAWVFKNTRVPVAALFENLRDGRTIANLRAPRLIEYTGNYSLKKNTVRQN